MTETHTYGSSHSSLRHKHKNASHPKALQGRGKKTHTPPNQLSCSVHSPPLTASFLTGCCLLLTHVTASRLTPPVCLSPRAKPLLCVVHAARLLSCGCLWAPPASLHSMLGEVQAFGLTRTIPDLALAKARRRREAAVLLVDGRWHWRSSLVQPTEVVSIRPSHSTPCFCFWVF